MTNILYLSEAFHILFSLLNFLWGYMKNTFALVLLLISLPSFASKARLIALGEDQDGSIYIQDNRNMFLNVAHINNYKDFVTLEWGGSGTTVTSTNGGDSDSSPKAEGGFTRASSGFVYGIYLGSESNTVARQRASAASFAGANTSFLQQDNVVDLFLGGDAGVQWGFNFTYSSAKDDLSDKKQGVGSSTASADGKFDANQSYVATRLGAIVGNIEFFALINLKNQAGGTKNTTTTLNNEAEKGDFFDEKLGYKVGGTFMFNDLRLFATQAFNKWDVRDEAEITALQNNIKSEVGVARVSMINDKTKFFTKFMYVRDAQKTNTTGSTQLSSNQNDKINMVDTNVPITVGLEHEVTSWFILRGSIAQQIYSKVRGDGLASSNNKKIKSTANSTSVNIGSTLTFGQLMLDGLIGTTGYETCSGGVCRNNGNKQGIISTDNILTRVALRYNF